MRSPQNEKYLTAKLKQIPGIVPRKSYRQTTAIAYYTYSFRYKKEHFNGLPRNKFLKALAAEGINFHVGGEADYHHNWLKKDSYLAKTLASKTFRKIYSKQTLDEYRQRNDCPDNEQTTKEMVHRGGKQTFLHTTKKDMDGIYSAILKIYENSDKLI